ncbi:hypothetical protein BH20ACT16_BH20ACT16_07260 [soil metagenome]
MRLDGRSRIGWRVRPTPRSLAVVMMRPSDGCTSTQPSPLNAIWKASPEPSPTKLLSLMSVFIVVVTPDDHATAACASANVGACETSSRTGGPSVSTATQPRSLQLRVEQPAADHPGHRLDAFAQSMPSSNARTLRPLTVMRSSCR